MIDMEITLTEVLPELLALDIATVDDSSVLYESVPLHVSLNVGQEDIVDNSGLGFRLVFNKVYLHIRRQNCEISLGSRYTETIDEEVFATNIEREARISGSEKLGAKFGIQFTTLFKKIIGTNITADGEKSIERMRSELQKFISKPMITLIGSLGRDRWYVGHTTLGDARKLSHLEGEYFTKKETPDDRMPSPLCILNPTKNSMNFSVTIETRVKFEDCIYIPLQNGRSVALHRNKRAIEKQLIMRSLQDQMHEWRTPGEITLTRTTASVRRG